MHCKFSKPDHEVNFFIMTEVVCGLIDYVLTILNTNKSTMSLFVSIHMIKQIKCLCQCDDFLPFSVYHNCDMNICGY